MLLEKVRSIVLLVVSLFAMPTKAEWQVQIYTDAMTDVEYRMAVGFAENDGIESGLGERLFSHPSTRTVGGAGDGLFGWICSRSSMFTIAPQYSVWQKSRSAAKHLSQQDTESVSHRDLNRPNDQSR